MVISKEMILALKTSHCVGIVVDKEAYIALMELAEKREPISFNDYQFEWPPTSAELSGMDRFCGGPSHEDYDASVYKGWMKPKVNALIEALNNARATAHHYRHEAFELSKQVNALKANQRVAPAPEDLVYQIKYNGVGGGHWTDVTPYQYKMLRKEKHYEGRILYTRADNETQ
ncbi:hypothetical protein pf16_15 [Pseudomonas phage pf16]|uniref:Uncharacterized protein n=1 Tax=Pseudomonas phage pf16 TaxID=1815630 RepID=A0A1S5R3H1_9CAUD|nr:hypothetical protein FDG98_gp014 [Pseudomonas phage pf16]AND74938.1 hypothetical protein pf16_15 [Pseudomonas phage pf16]